MRTSVVIVKFLFHIIELNSRGRVIPSISRVTISYRFYQLVTTDFHIINSSNISDVTVKHGTQIQCCVSLIRDK